MCSRNRRRPCFHIRNQSFLLLFVLVLHDVMATRQRSDELRVMDICIGTFPFPRQPLFTLNVLHIIHQYHPPGQFTSRPICAGAFFFHYSLFYSVSDWRKRIRALPPFRQKEWWRETERRRKCGLTSHLFFSIKSGRREGLKQNDKSVGESVLETMVANQ